MRPAQLAALVTAYLQDNGVQLHAARSNAADGHRVIATIEARRDSVKAGQLDARQLPQREFKTLVTPPAAKYDAACSVKMAEDGGVAVYWLAPYQPADTAEFRAVMQNGHPAELAPLAKKIPSYQTVAAVLRYYRAQGLRVLPSEGLAEMLNSHVLVREEAGKPLFAVVHQLPMPSSPQDHCELRAPSVMLMASAIGYAEYKQLHEFKERVGGRLEAAQAQATRFPAALFAAARDHADPTDMNNMAQYPDAVSKAEAARRRRNVEFYEANRAELESVAEALMKFMQEANR